ncbi:hypothetical protein AX774_g3588 [Zancudomyces culisetae]|uniref:Uncharacterized protein n=1 Tax=Zancudomyces culisetae TaxID=1213189 RepID=A0A1R1PPV5_ZANCU|nr:hypothetical protein AX774_g3588 [Zancudomyces culisetae]|eukprot:OMH82912.1 hypothetical protein AX774_g3588 [Zancudomyces culisetae]
MGSPGTGGGGGVVGDDNGTWATKSIKYQYRRGGATDRRGAGVVRDRKYHCGTAVASADSFLHRCYQTQRAESLVQHNTIPPPVTLDLPDSAHKVLGLVEDLLNLRSLSPKTSTRNRRYLYALTPNEGLSIVKQSTVTDTKGEMGDIPTQFIVDELHRFVNYVYDIATSTQSLLSYEKDIFRWNLNYRLQNELAAFTNVSSFIKSQVSKQLEIESSLLSSTEKAKLWICLKDFDIALSKGRMDLTPTTLSRLHSTVYAQKLSQTSIEYFVELYTKLYHSIAISSNADSHVLLVSDGVSQEYDQAMVESIVPKDVTIHNPTSLKLLL